MHETATGIGEGLASVSNQNGPDLLVALYGSSALQGSGAFLKVTYDMTSPVNGLPFAVAAQANEGQIPITWSPTIPGGGGGRGPTVSADKE